MVLFPRPKENPPPKVLNKGSKGWITEATPIRREFAYAHRMHVTSLHPTVVDLSSKSDDDAAASSDSNDDFLSIFLPSGFQPAFMPPRGNLPVPLDPAGQQMTLNSTNS